MLFRIFHITVIETKYELFVTFQSEGLQGRGLGGREENGTTVLRQIVPV
jgi:hypothetical protein